MIMPTWKSKGRAAVFGRSTTLTSSASLLKDSHSVRTSPPWSSTLRPIHSLEEGRMPMTSPCFT